MRSQATSRHHIATPLKPYKCCFDSKHRKAYLVQLLDPALQPVVHQLPVALDLTDFSWLGDQALACAQARA